MNILFVLGSYLPKPSPNGICVENIANEFISRGDKVSCLCNKKYYDMEKNLVINGINVYRITGNPLDEAMQKYRNSKINILNKILYVLINSFRRLTVAISTPFWPHEITFRAARLYKTALRLYSMNKYDMIICVNTPYQSLITGYKLKRRHPEITYVPYFLDALAGGRAGRSVSKTANKKRTLKFENKYLSNADKIIYMESSKKFHEKYDKDKVWYKKAVYLDIPLFTLVNTESIPRNESSGINIVFAGTLDIRERNPDAFLQAFVQMNIPDVKITFIGKHNCDEIFEKYACEHTDIISTIGFIPHDAMKRELEKADILLNIGNVNPNMVPSKIFEYMSYGKPIISMFSSEDDTSLPYLRKYPNVLLLNDKDNVSVSATRMKEFIQNTEIYDFKCSDTKNIFYLNTSEAFVNTIINKNTITEIPRQEGV